MSLFTPEQLEKPHLPAVAVPKHTAVQHALARLKQFRAGRIEMAKPDIKRDLDTIFQFVEQVTT